MHSDLALDPSAARIRLAPVAGVASGTSLLSAFPGALPACNVSVDKLSLLSLLILPDSEVAARAPPPDDSTKRMPPSAASMMAVNASPTQSMDSRLAP